MIRLILVIFCATRVNLEVQSVQYHMHVSRKSRSNTAPLESGYVYSKVDNNPATFAAYGNGVTGDTITRSEPYSRDDYTRKQSDVFGTNLNDIVYASVADKYEGAIGAKHDDEHEKNSKQNKINSLLAKYSSPPASVHSSEIVEENMPVKFSTVNHEKFADKIGNAQYYDHAVPAPYYGSVEPRISLVQPSIHMEGDYETNQSKSVPSTSFMLSKLKSDAMYEKLKSLMHYRPSAADMNMDYSYNPLTDYHVDDDDIRTSSRSSYSSWPYFYHTPYEYEHSKLDSDLQKAKDKRYAIDTPHKVIPVHEYHDHDTPKSYRPPVRPSTSEATTDNPISGNQPFFSFVLSDYFDQQNDEDPLRFKGLSMDDDDYYYYDDDTESKRDKNDRTRNRRLQSNYYPNSDVHTNNVHYDSTNPVRGDVVENTYNKKHEYDQHKKGDNLNTDERKGYENNQNNYKGFKNFVDTFANKFGSEDHKKNAKYAMTMNQDKGEKRKGFRRVYHKDEYQEDNEFYDSNNKSTKGEENLNSLVHRGGSEAFLKSQAAAAAANEANSRNKAGNTHRNKYESNKRGHDAVKGLNRDINRYRDVAKKTALGNSVDYIDHFNV